MKKKILIFGLLIVILLVATLLYVKHKNTPITVYYNNSKIYLINEPEKQEDTVYLPAKNILVGIYGEDDEIKYNRDKNILSFNESVVITAGSTKVLVEGNEKEYSMPAIVENGVFLIPMEYLDAFNLKADYSSLTNKVKITGDEPVNKQRYEVSENEETNTYTYTIDNISYTYDKHINLVYKEDNEYWISCSYDHNDNLVFYSTSDGKTEEFTYDENGRVTYKENQDREWTRYEYDENGNVTEEHGNINNN